MRFSWVVAALSLCVAQQIQGQDSRVRDRGPGRAGRTLAQALAGPHVLVPPGNAPVLLPRDSIYGTSVIVLGRDVVVEATVHGNVIAVGGDLFMHPGAVIDGSGIAMGGGAYPSMLATVRGGLKSYRDFTFDITVVGDTFVLDYRSLRTTPSPVFQLPGVFGLRMPTYDRTNGLSVPFAPLINLGAGRLQFEPTVTYRSQLGVVDPSLTGTLALGRRTRAELFVGRATYTNDAWIWSDLVNSASVLGLGLDTRNYYRANRAEATLHRTWETTTATLEPFVGARIERDWSVRPGVGATGGPWSFFGRDEADRILRPNPSIMDGEIGSALAGLDLDWQAADVSITGSALAEFGDATGDALVGGPAPESRFVQFTARVGVGFPTFATQRYRMDAHMIFTGGHTAPPQRWGYIGGSGSLPFLDLLSQGGDQLLYVENSYMIPLDQLALPLLGAPTVTLRHILGAAGVGSLPRLEQNFGARVAISIIRAEVLVDPVRRETRVGVGLSLAR